MNNCDYIFKIGPLKGTICDNRCKHDKCTVHTEKYMKRCRDYINQRYKLEGPERKLKNQNKVLKKRGAKKGQKRTLLKYHVEYIDVFKSDEPTWEVVGDFPSYTSISEAFKEKYNKDLSVDVLKSIFNNKLKNLSKHNIKIIEIINEKSLKEKTINKNIE